MRVFYVDEEDQSKRRYYVKIDNVNVPEELKGYKVIEAGSVEELKKLVMVQYDLNKNKNVSIELWSGQNYMGQRLDILDKIPKEMEFIWVRVVVNKVA
jgi:hypothetical protein